MTLIPIPKIPSIGHLHFLVGSGHKNSDETTDNNPRLVSRNQNLFR